MAYTILLYNNTPRVPEAQHNLHLVYIKWHLKSSRSTQQSTRILDSLQRSVIIKSQNTWFHWLKCHFHYIANWMDMIHHGDTARSSPQKTCFQPGKGRRWKEQANTAWETPALLQSATGHVRKLNSLQFTESFCLQQSQHYAVHSYCQCPPNEDYVTHHSYAAPGRPELKSLG